MFGTVRNAASHSLNSAGFMQYSCVVLAKEISMDIQIRKQTHHHQNKLTKYVRPRVTRPKQSDGCAAGSQTHLHMSRPSIEEMDFNRIFPFGLRPFFSFISSQEQRSHLMLVIGEVFITNHTPPSFPITNNRSLK